MLLDDLEAGLEAGHHLDPTGWTPPDLDGPLPASLTDRAADLLARIDARRRELEIAQQRVGAELDELAARRRSVMGPGPGGASGVAGRFGPPRTATLDRLA